MSVLKPFFSALFLLGILNMSAAPAGAVVKERVLPEQPYFAEGDESKSGPEATDEEGGKDKKKPDLPLAAARTIEIATDEVTWMSLDVSPDGATIIFEMLGDLYTMPAAGGEATLLIGGMGFESQPTYSPDGSLIAFISDKDGANNLWIANADGSDPVKLTKDKKSEFASPDWSSDGQYVYVSRVNQGIGTNEIWMYHKDGGSGVQLTKSTQRPNQPRDERHNALGPVAAPDGRFIYYSQRIGGFQYNQPNFGWNIARYDLRDGKEDILIQAQGSAMRPVLSPDGNLLVYATRYEADTGLRLRNIVTGEDNWLVYPVQRDDQESRATRDLMPNMSFTPDGRELLYNADSKLKAVNIASREVRDIPFSVNASIELGPDLHVQHMSEQGPVEARVIQGPALSPDGKTVAFSAFAHIYTMELAAGAQPKRLTNSTAPEFQPAWSPDGRWITYVTWSADNGGHIWRMRANGSGRPRQLTERAGFYASPAISPDGQTLVALHAANYDRVYPAVEFGPVPGLDIVRLPADGGEVRLVSPSRGFGSPHFGKSSDRLFVYSQGGLMSMRLDGSDIRPVVQVKGPGLYFAEKPVPANDIRISPDENWALAYVGGQLHVLAVPHVGKPVEVNMGGAKLPMKQITDMGADFFGWADGGKTMTWSVGSTVYRQPFDSVEFREKKKDDEQDNGKDEDSEEPDEGDGDGDNAMQTGEGEEGAKAEADEDAEDEEEPPLYDSFRVVVSMPRDVPRGKVLLSGARVITMGEAGVIENGDVLIEDNRVAAVGPSGSLEGTAGATVIDVAGKTVMPGFVDTHAHWFDIRRGILDVRHYDFLANLAYGVTAGLDVQTATNDMFSHEDMIEAGMMIGPRIFSTGPGVFSNNAFKSKKHALGVLKRYKEHYRTGNIKAYISGNRQQRQWVVQAAKELGIMPTTEGALDLRLDLTHMIDGFSGTEHALPIVPLGQDVVQLTAQSGIGYTPTLLVAYGGPWAENYYYALESPHDDAKLNRFTPHHVIDAKTKRRPWFRPEEHIFQRLATEAGKVIDAGGYVGVGSHGQLQGLGYHWELWSLASGTSEMNALKAATILGAHIIGREAEVGSLEAGKFADLVILDGNPLEDIRQTAAIDRIMKNGRIYDGETLDEVYPEQKPLGPQWFHNLNPETK